MKAITVRQPWASLIAAGVKTIETRPRPTSYRGRIAIHAGQVWPKQGTVLGDWQVDWGLDPSHRATISGTPHMGDGCGYLLVHYADGVIGAPAALPLYLGAVVASAVLTDCVPVVADTTRWEEGTTVSVGPGNLKLGTRMATGAGVMRCIDDQLPFGDFSPGRWALLLDDIAPTTDRCPWCWGEFIWPEECELCGRAGVCDPVPARGQQAVPWEWTP